MPKNLALFLAKNGQKSGSKFKKMAQKNLSGKNGGERKINPSANPEMKYLAKGHSTRTHLSDSASGEA